MAFGGLVCYGEGRETQKLKPLKGTPFIMKFDTGYKSGKVAILVCVPNFEFLLFLCQRYNVINFLFS